MKKYEKPTIDIIILDNINIITTSNEAEWDFPDEENPDSTEE